MDLFYLKISRREQAVNEVQYDEDKALLEKKRRFKTSTQQQALEEFYGGSNSLPHLTWL